MGSAGRPATGRFTWSQVEKEEILIEEWGNKNLLSESISVSFCEDFCLYHHAIIFSPIIFTKTFVETIPLLLFTVSGLEIAED